MSDEPVVARRGVTTADGHRITMHVALAKDYLLRQIALSGAKGVLKDWPGTDAEAIAAVAADPRDWFVVDSTRCDNQSKDGRCLGHPREAEQEIGGQQ